MMLAKTAGEIGVTVMWIVFITVTLIFAVRIYSKGQRRDPGKR